MKKTLLFLLILGSVQTWAEDEVLQEAQAMMQDRGQIEKLAQEDSGVKRADEFVNSVVGTGQEKDTLLKISSDYMGQLVKKHNVDIGLMQADLLNSLKDPKKFLEGLSPEYREQIRKLAGEVETKKKPAVVTAPKP